MFTAAYVTAFENMSGALARQMIPPGLPQRPAVLNTGGSGWPWRWRTSDSGRPSRTLNPSGSMWTRSGESRHAGHHQVAADYGISAKRLNQILPRRGHQYNVNGQWILYKKHMGKGYTKSRTIHITHSDGRPDTKMQTQWTQKGEC